MRNAVSNPVWRMIEHRVCLYKSWTRGKVLRAILVGTAMHLMGIAAVNAQPAVLTNGLVAYYPFNGDARDKSGNSLDGVASGVLFGTNRFGAKNSAAAFDGITSRIVVDDHGELNKLPITLSLWIKIGANSGAANGIIQKYFASSANGWFLYGAANSLVSGWFGTAGEVVPESYAAFATILDYRWHHAVVVFGVDSMTCYHDGVLAKKVPWQGSASDAASRAMLVFGENSPENVQFRLNFHGGIDDVRIFNRALSQVEAAELYQYEGVPSHSSGPRIAAANAQVVNGFVVGANVIDGGGGYTEAPSVVISGGGGSGASAVAILDGNGSVARIEILTTGTGYTSLPSIIIADPPYPATQAKGTAMAINGFVTGVTLTEGGRGYGDTPPPIYLFGGGGSGAKAFTTVSNGVVTGVTMTAAGAGYTSAPTVLIAEPPGSPSLGIDVARVRVTLNVLVGYWYKLQTSVDGGSTWTDVGEAFLATERSSEHVFDVMTRTQLFRVVQAD